MTDISTDTTFTGPIAICPEDPIRPIAGVTVTIDGSVIAPHIDAPIFDLSLGGKVIVTGFDPVCANWWSGEEAGERISACIDSSPNAIKIIVVGRLPLCTGINATDHRGVDPGQRIPWYREYDFTGSILVHEEDITGALFDMVGSRWCTVRGFTVVRPDSGIYPIADSGILMGRNASGKTAGGHLFERCQIASAFRIACLVNWRAEGVDHISCSFDNGYEGVGDEKPSAVLCTKWMAPYAIESAFQSLGLDSDIGTTNNLCFIGPRAFALQGEHAESGAGIREDSCGRITIIGGYTRAAGKGALHCEHSSSGSLTGLVALNVHAEGESEATIFLKGQREFSSAIIHTAGGPGEDILGESFQGSSIKMVTAGGVRFEEAGSIPKRDVHAADIACGGDLDLSGLKTCHGVIETKPDVSYTTALADSGSLLLDSSGVNCLSGHLNLNGKCWIETERGPEPTASNVNGRSRLFVDAADQRFKRVHRKNSSNEYTKKIVEE